MPTSARLLLWAAADPAVSPSPLEWLTAGGTVAAVLVALAFGIVAERRSRQDRIDRAAEVEKARELAHRAQAERVAIWAYEDDSRIDAGTGRPAVSIHLVNASDLPVVHVHVPGNAAWGGWLPQTLLPGQSKYVELSYAELAAFDEPLERPGPDRERLRVVFMDNAGTNWTRSFTGELSEG